MKFNKFLIGLVAVAALSISSALAQNDVFSTVRSLPVGSPTVLAIGGTPATNGPVDIVGFIGRGDLLITSFTNGTGGGTLTATVESSPDNTNWTQVANFALIKSTTAVSYTNTYYGSYTNLVVTDNFLLPGTITTPTASSSGFATPYLSPVLFTNAAGAVSIAGNGNYVIGLNLTDSQRYLHVIWGGSATNGTCIVNAVLQGYRFVTP
jgi:hypothetical protein